MNKLSKYFIVLFSIFSLVIASSPFVSALTSNGSTLTLEDSTNMYTPGYIGSDIYPNITNTDDSIVACFQVSSSGTRQLQFYFKFDSPNIYGTLKLYIYSNQPDTYSNIVSSPQYQGVFDWNGNALGWGYGHLNYDTVLIEYTGYIPDKFMVRTYYDVSNPTTAYFITDYVFIPFDKGSQDIIANDNANTDKILGAGSDVAQPDFGSTNGQIDDTVGQIESIEGAYKIDAAETQNALDKGNSFLQGSDMQRASIQVKTWIEKFVSDSPMMNGFFIAAMVLGLCFWVIGRKAGTK